MCIRDSFYFVLIACVTNIILDLVLVAGLGWGAFGAAVATVFSQALSMILCIIYMVRNGFVFDFRPSSFRIYKHELEMIFKIGTPAAIQNGVTSFSFLIITALVNSIGGVNASAAVGVVGKFNGFAIMPAVAMGSSISTMCAQNVGAGQWDRVKKTCLLYTSTYFCARPHNVLCETAHPQFPWYTHFPPQFLSLSVSPAERICQSPF